MPAKKVPELPVELLQAADADVIRMRVTQLVTRMLDEFEDQLDSAPPQAKRELLKSAIPALMRALQDEETTNTEVEVMRAELEALYGEIRKGVLSIPARVVEK